VRYPFLHVGQSIVTLRAVHFVVYLFVDGVVHIQNIGGVKVDACRFEVCRAIGQCPYPRDFDIERREHPFGEMAAVSHPNAKNGNIFVFR